MNDRLPGTTYDNPLWHRGWRIYTSVMGGDRFGVAYVHDDYDGAPNSNDDRCGHAESVAAAKTLIDASEDAERNPRSAA